MASSTAGERLIDKFNFVQRINHGGGGTITRPRLGKSTMVSARNPCACWGKCVYIGVNKESVRFGKLFFAFVDQTLQEFAAIHAALKTANLWSVLLCFAPFQKQYPERLACGSQPQQKRRRQRGPPRRCGRYAARRRARSSTPRRSRKRHEEPRHRRGGDHMRREEHRGPDRVRTWSPRVGGGERGESKRPGHSDSGGYRRELNNRRDEGLCPLTGRGLPTVRHFPAHAAGQVAVPNRHAETPAQSYFEDCRGTRGWR